MHLHSTDACDGWNPSIKISFCSENSDSEKYKWGDSDIPAFNYGISRHLWRTLNRSGVAWQEMSWTCNWHSD